MNGVKLGFSMVDLARSWGRGIGSVHLKDGSSMKFLGKPDDTAVDFIRVKNGRLLSGTSYRGKDAVSKAANYVGYIEKMAQNPADVDKAWDACFDLVV